MKTKIKNIRLERGLTQKELAEKSRRSERQIIRIENDEQDPNAETLVNIAAALGATVGELLGEWDGCHDTAISKTAMRV